MFRALLLTILLFFHLPLIFGQQIINLEVYYGSHDHKATNTYYSNNGEVYLAGEYKGEIIVGFNYHNAGDQNSAYFAKKLPSGQITFLKSFRSTGFLSVTSLVANNDLVIVGGTYSDSLFLGNDTLVNGNFKGMYIAFFDTLGNYQYALNSNSYSSELFDISFVSGSEIAFTGEFYGPLSIGDFDLNSLFGFNMFLVHYNFQTGQVNWGKSSIGVATNGKSVRSDLNGDIYITGSYGEGTTFDGTVLSGVAGDHNQYIAKYSEEGNLCWIKTITGPVQTHGLGLAVCENGDSFVSGEFEFSIDIPNVGTLFNNGLMDGFIAKIDKDGNFIWGKSIGSSDNDQGLKIALDQYGNPILLMNAGKSISHDGHDLSSNGFRDPLVLKLNRVNGDYVWHYRIPSAPPSGIVDGYSIATYNDKISICGSNRTGILFENEVYDSPNYDDSFWATIVDTNVFDPSLSLNHLEIITPTISPNPFTDLIHIHSPEEITTIEIYDNRFALILKSNLENVNHFTVTNSLPEGIYYIKLISKENHFFSKAIKR
jgi:hypothetical protein